MITNMDCIPDGISKYTAIIVCRRIISFRDRAFIFFTAYFYYEDKATLDEGTENMLRQAMKAFDGAVPTYHIELHERPVLVWDFHSLVLCIQMMFSFALTDKDSELRICKKCGRVFTAKTPGAEFCSRECENMC